MKTYTKQLVIRSNDRINSNDSTANFSVVIEPEITAITKVTLLSAEIPNTIHNITSDNQTFNWQTSDGFNSSIQIPTGFYSIDEYIDQFKGKVDIEQAITGTTDDLNIEFYNHKGHFFLYQGTDFNAHFGNSSVSAIMGYDSVNQTGSEFYESDNIVDFFPDLHSLYIRFPNLPVNKLLSSNGLSAFAKIPMQANNYAIDFYAKNDTFCQAECFTPVTLQSLEVQLLNENGEIVNLNNADWSFTLKLDVLAKGFI